MDNNNNNNSSLLNELSAAVDIVIDEKENKSVAANRKRGNYNHHVTNYDRDVIIGLAINNGFTSKQIFNTLQCRIKQSTIKSVISV